MQGVIYTGVISKEELRACPGMPGEKRMKAGAVARVECVQEIPCNPCEGACPMNAIRIGENITDLPVLVEDACTGCGLCVANCPGLAITVVDKSGDAAKITFPFEYLPLPKVGDSIDAVGRDGRTVCRGTVLKIRDKVKAYDGTTVITISLPTEFADDVVSMKRL